MAEVKAIDQEFIDAMTKRVQEARLAIEITKIVSRLQKAALGLIYMSKEELKAAEILLKHSMPALRELEVKGEVNHKHSLEELVMQSMKPQLPADPFVDPMAPPTQH